MKTLRRGIAFSLAWVVFCALVLQATPGFAQVESMPRPEEIGADDGIAPIVIGEPADGAAVKVPFKVSGNAPPGARLELWLGDTLDRSFQADSKGYFTAAVSRDLTGSTELFIHQIGNRGIRVQSASITVDFAGAAAVLPPDTGSADGTEDEVPPTDGVVAQGAIPLTPDVELDTLQQAPEPPSVEAAQQIGLQGDAAEAEMEVDQAPGTVSRYVYRSAGPNRALRASLEGLVGFGSAVAGGAIGIMVGVPIGLAVDPSGWGGVILGILGGATGYVIGLPIGVILTGRAMDGNGKLWAVIVGEVIGLVGAGVLTGALANNGAGGPVSGLLLAILPVTGAVAGFELTSDLSRSAAKNPTVSIGPFVTPSEDGTWAFGPALRGSF